MRFPFLVRYPRLFPKRNLFDQMVLDIDFAPTFPDLARLPFHPGLHSTTFRELALGIKPAPLAHLIPCLLPQGIRRNPTRHGIRTGGAKHIVYPRNPEWIDVCDLKNGPCELRSLLAGGSLATRLKFELEKQMRAVDFHW